MQKRQRAFFGSVTLAVLYRAMHEIGAPPDEACFVLTEMILAGDIATRPALGKWFRIRPSEDGRTASTMRTASSKGLLDGGLERRAGS